MKLAVSVSSLVFALLGVLALAHGDVEADNKDLEGTWLPLSAEISGRGVSG